MYKGKFQDEWVQGSHNSRYQLGSTGTDIKWMQHDATHRHMTNFEAINTKLALTARAVVSDLTWLCNRSACAT